eukprot:SAG31_NODE_4647_length_3070_cov_2.252777_2_plen_110_part_00
MESLPPKLLTDSQIIEFISAHCGGAPRSESLSAKRARSPLRSACTAVYTHLTSKFCAPPRLAENGFVVLPLKELSQASTCKFDYTVFLCPALVRLYRFPVSSAGPRKAV